MLLDTVSDARPLASTDAFVDYVGRYATLGITDIVVHHPRAEDPNWDDPPDSLDRIAATVLPGLRGGDAP
jgi:hypothetical protein